MGRILSVSVEHLNQAAAALRAGELVAFPTETVYGLGANALDSMAVGKIFAAKGRPATNPVIVHIAALEIITELTTMTLAQENRLLALAAFWPGPLTVVLPRSAAIPDIVTAGGPTVALRIPIHPVAQALLRFAGLPLAAPSANRSEELSPTRAQHVLDSLRDRVDIILDSGACEVGLESTVVDISVWPPRLLRPGAITAAELETVLAVKLGGANPSDTFAKSPGQRARHYAPRTPLRIVEAIWKEAALAPGAAVIAYTLPDKPPPAAIRAAAILPSEPSRYGQTLYETLHRLDRLSPSVILVEQVPQSDSWEAVRDRLMRAAAKG